MTQYKTHLDSMLLVSPSEMWDKINTPVYVGLLMQPPTPTFPRWVHIPRFPFFKRVHIFGERPQPVEIKAPGYQRVPGVFSHTIPDLKFGPAPIQWPLVSYAGVWDSPAGGRLLVWIEVFATTGLCQGCIYKLDLEFSMSGLVSC